LFFNYFFIVCFSETDDADDSVAGLRGADRNRVVDFAGIVNDTGNNGPTADQFAFTMEDIKDAVISKRTFASYVGPIHVFLQYCAGATEAPYCNVLTNIGRETVRLLEPNTGEKMVAHNKRRMVMMQRILRESSENALIDFSILSGDEMMTYFLQVKGTRSGQMLSRPMFSQHRSALNHLYRCHNRCGIPNIAADSLKTLFKGLHRSFAKHRKTGVNRRVRTATDDQGTVATGRTGMVLEEAN
jgi:hypothetical protein